MLFLQFFFFFCIYILENGSFLYTSVFAYWLILFISVKSLCLMLSSVRIATFFGLITFIKIRRVLEIVGINVYQSMYLFFVWSLFSATDSALKLSLCTLFQTP